MRSYFFWVFLPMAILFSFGYILDLVIEDDPEYSKVNGARSTTQISQQVNAPKSLVGRKLMYKRLLLALLKVLIILIFFLIIIVFITLSGDDMTGIGSCGTPGCVDQ